MFQKLSHTLMRAISFSVSSIYSYIIKIAVAEGDIVRILSEDRGGLVYGNVGSFAKWDSLES